MKKLTLCFTSMLICFTVVTACGKKNDLTRLAFVNFFSGNVFIINGTVKTAAKLGAEIKEGLSIQTEAGSFVEIAVGENIIKIMENTFVEVTKLSINSANGEDSAFFIKNGQVISRITKKLGKADSYKVTTPTSVASVRGTDFVVNEETGKSYIVCLDGKVEVRGADMSDSQSVNINGGQEVSVEPGKPLAVKELSELNKKYYEDILDDINAIQDDIKNRFESEREKIREKVQEQKDQNKEMIQRQREENKQRVEDQKRANKEKVDAVVENTNVKAYSEDAKKRLESVKPDMQKFKAGLKEDQSADASQ